MYVVVLVQNGKKYQFLLKRYGTRHTCATLLVHQGVPITTVQKLLGHTSVKTTEIYSEILSNTIVRDLKAVKRKRNVNSFQNALQIG